LNSSNISILGPVRRLIFIVVIATFSITMCFAFLLYESGQHESDYNIIINALGKQRMLTQLISKDASRLYALIDAHQTGKIYQPNSEIEDKILITKDSLIMARQSFAGMLSSIHSGSLTFGNNNIKLHNRSEIFTQDLEYLDGLWVHFDNAIDVIVNSTETNSDFANAVIFINENNIELLDYCDSLTQAVVDDAIQTKVLKVKITIGLLVLSLIIIAISLFNLSKYIIEPFSELYKGISEVGLSNFKLKTSIPTKKDVAPVVSEINGLFRKINYLISLIENMNKSSSFNETLEFIFKSFSLFIPYTYIGIALFHNDNKVLEASYGVSDGTMIGLPNSLMGKEVLIRDTSLEKVVNFGEARIINDLELYTADKPLKEYNRIILEAGVRSSITLPLKVSDEPVGVIFFSSNKKNVYNEEHVKFLKTIVNSIAISFDKNIYVNDLIYSSILALAKLAESRDEDTGEHLDRMKIYSRDIAKYLFESNKCLDEITPEYINDIERFSPLHDIGKVGIRDGILLKPGKLTFDEFEEMKKHTTNGTEVLKAAESNLAKRGKSLFKLGIEIADGHHEKWDGSGYPNGKKGKEIPLSARIVAVADVFDALTSRRPYKEPFSFEESFNIIVDGSGKHFDPEIVATFVENKGKIEHLYKNFKLR